MGTISKGTAQVQKQGSVGIALRLASVAVAGSLLSGCVAQVAHAVFSPVLDSASHALQTPESVGITPASWRGKSCKDLASSYDYKADVQRKTAASGDAHMAKVHGWQMDAIQQVRNEQHCLTPDNTASTASTAPPAPTASVPATSPNQAATDLGLTLQSPSPELVKALGLEDGKGAWVVSVTPGSPAARAGLKPMDVILDVAGQMVSVPADVLAIAGKMRAGYQAPLSVWRDHSEKSLTLSIPSGLMAAAVPATPPAALPVAAPAASPVAAAPGRLEYCYLYLTSSDYHKDPDVLSPVFRDASVNTSVQQQMAAMKAFVAKVNRQQPGIWQDFAYNAAQCNTNSGVCFAAAKPVFGPAQSVMLRCFASSAEADTKRSADEVADPTATTLAMP